MGVVKMTWGENGKWKEIKMETGVFCKRRKMGMDMVVCIYIYCGVIILFLFFEK